MSSTFVLPSWISVLQCSDWISPRKFILDESSVLFCLFMTLLDGILSPGQLITPALMLAIDFSLRVIQTQSDNLSLNQKTNLSSIERKIPTIMG